MLVNVKKLHPDAKLPTYGTVGAGAFDFYALERGVVMANSSHVFGTGLAIEVPWDHVMLIYSRSGHGFGYNIRLANCVGVIDSDYRGELKIKLTCDDPDIGLVIEAGERIAQGMIIPVKKNLFQVVETLSETVRGSGGFGSTGN